jgi:serine/threonine protein kinase
MGILDHPGSVAMYALGENERLGAYYVTQRCGNVTLLSLIECFHRDTTPNPNRNERRLAFARLLRHFVDVCHAVAYANDRGLIHGDIKPAIISVGQFGETLVGDWHLARLIGGSRLDETTTSSQIRRGFERVAGENRPPDIVGTPGYMSPERAQGRFESIGPASDVFLLGATLYHILTGKPPYTGTRVMDVIASAHRCEFRPPRKVSRMVPPALEAICLKAMAREPNERYATASKLAEDVERWSLGLPVTAYRKPLLARLAHRIGLERRRL